MINVMRVRNVRADTVQQLAHPPARLQRIDHALRAHELIAQAIGMTELDLIREILRPGTRQILWMSHCERDDLPADALEHPVLLKKKNLRAATRVVVVVYGKQTRSRAEHRITPTTGHWSDSEIRQ